MDCNSTTLSYGETGYFSKIIVDYIEKSDHLSSFYTHEVSMKGMAQAINARQHYHTNRSLLVTALEKQYGDVKTTALVTQNILSLASEDTFTICTAHQPVIFTGTLYFIYKILHAVKLAADCEKQFPGKHFVPVFYMGSEDADLEELGKIFLQNEKIVWDTKQKGAVGRMKTTGLEKIINRIEGEVGVYPKGKELTEIFRSVYLQSPDMQTATFRLLNILFQEYGLVILMPDNADLKRHMISLFEDDLFNQRPSEIVEKTTKKLEAHYKVQANPRAINLFYLKDDIRELISYNGKEFEVRNTNLRFSAEEIKEMLHSHPERFSPNVILRGLFQEQILPNIAFIGGGGETAYWLELRELFEHYQTPFPMLVLRNSFLLIEQKWSGKLAKLKISETEIFADTLQLVKKFVMSASDKQLTLTEEMGSISEVYSKLKSLSSKVDQTLIKHVEALETKAIKSVNGLEKKLLKAEKRKFEEQQRQINHVKSALFPLNGLQERIDNFITWYAQYGKDFFDIIYKNSRGLEPAFVVLTIV